jgi:hypothetical protein
LPHTVGEDEVSETDMKVSSTPMTKTRALTERVLELERQRAMNGVALSESRERRAVSKSSTYVEKAKVTYDLLDCRILLDDERIAEIWFRTALFGVDAVEADALPDALEESVEVKVGLARDDDGVGFPSDSVDLFQRNGVDLVVAAKEGVSLRKVGKGQIAHQ